MKQPSLLDPVQRGPLVWFNSSDISLMNVLLGHLRGSNIRLHIDPEMPDDAAMELVTLPEGPRSDAAGKRKVPRIVCCKHSEAMPSGALSKSVRMAAIRLHAWACIEIDESGDTNRHQLVETIRAVSRGEYQMFRFIKSPQDAFNELVAKNGGECPLTPKQSKLMRMVVSGLPNRDIAEHLRLTEQTIKNDMSKIYRKLNVKSRTAALNVCVSNGWVG